MLGLTYSKQVGSPTKARAGVAPKLGGRSGRQGWVGGKLGLTKPEEIRKDELEK